MTIKSWAVDDRPREKLMSKGAFCSLVALQNFLQFLIGSGNKQESAVDLSKRILDVCSVIIFINYLSLR